HSPLRLSQSLRTICGRGYSGCTLSGRTSFAQRVRSGPLPGCQSAAVGEIRQAAKAMKKIEVRFIELFQHAKAQHQSSSGTSYIDADANFTIGRPSPHGTERRAAVAKNFCREAYDGRAQAGARLARRLP